MFSNCKLAWSKDNPRARSKTQFEASAGEVAKSTKYWLLFVLRKMWGYCFNELTSKRGLCELHINICGRSLSGTRDN